MEQVLSYIFYQLIQIFSNILEVLDKSSSLGEIKLERYLLEVLIARKAFNIYNILNIFNVDSNLLLDFPLLELSPRACFV